MMKFITMSDLMRIKKLTHIRKCTKFCEAGVPTFY